MRNKSNAAVQAVSGVLAGYPIKLVRGFMVRTFPIKLVMVQKDGKKGDQIIIFGGGKVGDDIKYLIKTFEMYVNIHAIDVKWWMCFCCSKLLFEGRVFFESFSRRVHVEFSSWREWNRMGVKSQVILPSRQEDISSFGPKNKIVWCTSQMWLGGIYDESTYPPQGNSVKKGSIRPWLWEN